MPRPRRSNLSRQSRNARRIQNTANERTEEEQEIAREQRRDSMTRLRASQSREQSEAARETARLAMQNRRANNRRQQIDNLSPFISKTFKTHCNVEYCNSVKSIKYICKYVTKGIDMAVFELQSSNTNDEISRYQVGRYVNCYEAIWRISAFLIHERNPTVGWASGEWSTSIFHGFECYATC
ncbi:uncharacterized protein LOC129940030 [Eupeodes corollae]|uniref:uncharacterized protein LOC129940030 n=1 Tax=Eupeodes corollae TaxID=290404 RepID=UPI002493187D|nr:uncharacterized protein LOC129940030 [Eupeodes corollae]